MKSILIVEDEPHIRNMIKFGLEQEYFTDEVDNVDGALELIQEKNFNLIILDWMLPGLTGIELARRLKRMNSTRHIPIIMLTARSQEQDKLKGFNEGIDDYVSKPFSFPELKARISAVLRRSTNQDNSQKLNFLVSSQEKKIFIEGVELKLTKREFLIVSYLFKNKHRVCTRSEIILNCWDDYVYDRVVDVNIRRIRVKFKLISESYIINSIRGFGYQFIYQKPPNLL